MARHQDVYAALTDHETFCSSRGAGLADFHKEKPWRPPSLLLEADPPDHTSTRGAMGKVISASTVRGFRETFRAEAEAVADELVARGHFDAITDLAEYHPLTVFPDAVGLRSAQAFAGNWQACEAVQLSVPAQGFEPFTLDTSPSKRTRCRFDDASSDTRLRCAHIDHAASRAQRLAPRPIRRSARMSSALGSPRCLRTRRRRRVGRRPVLWVRMRGLAEDFEYVGGAGSPDFAAVVGVLGHGGFGVAELVGAGAGG
jgi:cytochrome P450